MYKTFTVMSYNSEQPITVMSYNSKQPTPIKNS